MTILYSNSKISALAALGKGLSPLPGQDKMYAVLTGGVVLHVKVISNLGEAAALGGVYVCSASDPRRGYALYGDSARKAIEKGVVGKTLHIGTQSFPLPAWEANHNEYNPRNASGVIQDGWKLAQGPAAMQTEHIAKFGSVPVDDVVLFALPSTADYGLAVTGLDHTAHPLCFSYMGFGLNGNPSLRAGTDIQRTGFFSAVTTCVAIETTKTYGDVVMEAIRATVNDQAANSEQKSYSTRGLQMAAAKDPVVKKKFFLPLFFSTSSAIASYVGLGPAPVQEVMKRRSSGDPSAVSNLAGGSRVETGSAVVYGPDGAFLSSDTYFSVYPDVHGKRSNMAGRGDTNASVWYRGVPFAYFLSDEGIPLLSPLEVRCQVRFFGFDRYHVTNATVVSGTKAIQGTVRKSTGILGQNYSSNAIGTYAVFDADTQPGLSAGDHYVKPWPSGRAIHIGIDDVPYTKFSGVAPYLFFNMAGRYTPYNLTAKVSTSASEEMWLSMGLNPGQSAESRAVDGFRESVADGTIPLSEITSRVGTSSSVLYPWGAWLSHPLVYRTELVALLEKGNEMAISLV